jgi:hypothetical protein
MPVIPIRRPFAVAPAETVDGAGKHENLDPLTKCARCRLTFIRHPSIGLDASAEWWLCPPCRRGLLGDASNSELAVVVGPTTSDC